MDLQVRVQHHPKRAELLDRLLPLLEPLRTEVVEDPDPDNRRPSPWRTYLECLTREWEGTHLLIVQDDTLPCANFATAAVAALTAKPESIVSFFLTNVPARTVRTARAAHFNGERWAPVHPQDFIPTVATAYPRETVEHILRWAAKAVNASQIGDDGIMGRYVKLNKVQAWITVPSLVQHPDDVPSTLRHRSARQVPRTAIHWDEALDVTSIDWTQTA